MEDFDADADALPLQGLQTGLKRPVAFRLQVPSSARQLTPGRASPSDRWRSAHPTRTYSAEISEVAPRLYVGTMKAAHSAPTLEAHAITHVLNCTPLPNAFEGTPTGPQYLSLNLLDNKADLPRMHTAIREGVAFIGQALESGGTVLVHCHRGISRSCTLAMAHLIQEQQRSVEEVFAQMRHARRVCDPNLGYLCVLKEWERAVVVKKP